MKTIFTLFFSILLGTATAQTKFYDPKELKEDADYYFSTLFRYHPDPYYFAGKKKFNKLKEKIYSELNKPLSKNDFILTIAQMNSCLDTHSDISIDDALGEILKKPLMDKMKKAISSFSRDSIYTVSFQNFTDSLGEFIKERGLNPDSIFNYGIFFPVVETRGNKLFFLGDSTHNIIKINGILTKTMMSEAKKYVNRKLNPESNLNSTKEFINSMILGKYNINPPFRIKFGKIKREEIRNGISIIEWMNEFSGVTLASLLNYYTILYTYEIYPENSIAIFHIQTFAFEKREYFLEQLEKFKKEVDKQGIKYIFYDMTLNPGGYHEEYQDINIIKHDTVYFKNMKTTRIPGEGVTKERMDTVLLFPNRNDNNIPDDRILFVLQSVSTQSCGDYLSRIIAENKLGILVGEPTGELTKTFSITSEYSMPNTSAKFRVATVFFDFSEYFKSLTTSPDIYWNLKNVKEFTEQELLNVINAYKNKKTCIN